MVRGQAVLVTLDYYIEIAEDGVNEKLEFRFWYYPHKLARFTEMLDEVFERPAVHRIYGDFRPLEEVSSPAFYIHMLQKQN
ncbi:Glycine N-methyltransferase [Eumeta japonica]|uniref:Glycine N-methyltransferase n=1 Tax=Eumeta variegata TaxID=151549 RepID=A0A4C1SM62_EUMVA|nr:Glycine N-methyltransferase [Eumeta japonica]